MEIGITVCEGRSLFGGNLVKRVFVYACCLALCSAPALAKEKAGGAGMSDQQFIDFAAQTDMVEANLGQLAQSNASAPPVKDYAQTLVTDHNQDYNQLYDIAHQANLNRPDAIDADQERVIASFEKLKGEAFDHRYIQEMIAGHTKAIAIYKKEAANAQNPALKSYAEQTLPTLQKHLDAAKALEKAK
jgi:putative membrane protein